jgi:hypothetical protein
VKRKDRLCRIGGDTDGAHDVAGEAVTGQAEFARAALDGGNDLVGDVLVNVEAFGFHGVPLAAGPAGLRPRGAGGTGPNEPSDQTRLEQ